MTDLDVGAYLARIVYHGPVVADEQTLRALHRAHLYAVPFENLDIHLRRPIVLDLDRFFAKVVEGRRGGFCYELNGLFAALLQALGFQVELLSARVHGDRGYGPEFDHLTLLVHLERGLLVDVGFGDGFREPLYLDDPGSQVQDGSEYRLDHEGPVWTLWRREAEGTWEAQYLFTLQPRRLEDFATTCRYQQSSPDSHFTRGRVCTLLRPGGHVTLSDHRLIVVEHGRRNEQTIDGPAEFAAALREHFDMDTSVYC